MGGKTVPQHLRTKRFGYFCFFTRSIDDLFYASCTATTMMFHYRKPQIPYQQKEALKSPTSQPTHFWHFLSQHLLNISCIFTPRVLAKSQTGTLENLEANE
jgi:hypothetical protein